MKRIFASTVVTFATVGSHANVVVSSMASEPDMFTAAWIGGPVTHAAQFTTDGTAYMLLGVDALVRYADVVLAWIHADNGGLPGDRLLALEAVGTNSNLETLTFYADSAFVLSADTTYHLILSSPNATTASWALAESGMQISEGAGTIEIAREYSIDNGATWAEFTGDLLMFRISGIAVPTPASAGLLVIGGVVAVRQRRHPARSVKALVCKSKLVP